MAAAKRLAWRVAGRDAAGSLFVEPKLIHACGAVAHLEDVEMDAGADDAALHLAQDAERQARAAGCYKVIAACDDAAMAAFTRAGFVAKSLQMELSGGAEMSGATPPLLRPPRPEDVGAPPDVSLRPLEEADFHRDVLGLLAQLTEVGDVRQTEFCRRHAELSDSSGSTLVLVAHDGDRLLAMGTALLVQTTEGRGGASLRAHVEDVVVAAAERGRGLGATLIRALVLAARRAGAECVRLECSHANEAFYARLGFARTRTSMALYL